MNRNIIFLLVTFLISGAMVSSFQDDQELLDPEELIVDEAIALISEEYLIDKSDFDFSLHQYDEEEFEEFDLDIDIDPEEDEELAIIFLKGTNKSKNREILEIQGLYLLKEEKFDYLKLTTLTSDEDDYIVK